MPTHRIPPPGRPDARARRIIEQIRAYVAADPSIATAHGSRAIVDAAMAQADVAIVNAHDHGAEWSQIGKALGLQPGSVNQARARVRRREAAAQTPQEPITP